MRKYQPIILAALFGMLLFSSVPCNAEFTYELFDRPLTVMGYAQQSVGYGLESDDQYDTKQEFQSFLFQGLLETKYEPSMNFSTFASGKFNADWAYPLFDADDEWESKEFDEGRDDLYIYDEAQDILNEAHFTWTPDNFYFRLGKQIVAWGQTDGFKLMDQINPVDERRGLGDVQFESSVIPLWLVNAEYNTFVGSDWLQELGFQVVYNPNLEFRGNERIEPGNEKFGIWAADLRSDLGGPYPFDYAHVGSWVDNDRTPDGTFESGGMEVGAKIRGVIHDALVTLNGFYGRDNDIVRRVVGPPTTSISEFDNRPILHLPTEAKYPILRFVGFTFTRDFPSLSSSALGGVAPTWRAEAMYVIDFTTESELETFEESDEIRWMLGFDWKIKIDFLNPKAYFLISPQFSHRHIIDYANSVPGVDYNLRQFNGEIKKDNYTGSILLKTTYFHSKLEPLIFWMQDFTGEANLIKAQLSWEQNHHWKYTLGALFLDGQKENVSFEPLKHKDQAFFTVQYRF
jgi:hypothetical protein